MISYDGRNYCFSPAGFVPYIKQQPVYTTVEDSNIAMSTEFEVDDFDVIESLKAAHKLVWKETLSITDVYITHRGREQHVLSRKTTTTGETEVLLYETNTKQVRLHAFDEFVFTVPVRSKSIMLSDTATGFADVTSAIKFMGHDCRTLSISRMVYEFANVSCFYDRVFSSNGAEKKYVKLQFDETLCSNASVICKIISFCRDVTRSRQHGRL